MGECSCVNTLNEHIECSRDSLIVKKNTMRLTWDDQTDFVHASYCLFIPIDYALCKFQIHKHKISAKLSGQKLNEEICDRLNRQGAQCISGYGPAALSDGVSCADCSKHRHLWILNLLLQPLYLIIML